MYIMYPYNHIVILIHFLMAVHPSILICRENPIFAEANLQMEPPGWSRRPIRRVGAWPSAWSRPRNSFPAQGPRDPVVEVTVEDVTIW